MPSDRPPKRRGRPRQSADPGAPPQEWLESLSPTALHVVEVARGILIAEGFEALTIERVAFDSDVDPSTVKRHFVSRAGLLLAILDRLQIAAWEELVARLASLPDEANRRDLYLRRQGDLDTDDGASAALVEAIVHGLRDPIVREKVAISYDIWRDTTLRAMELHEPADAGQESRHRAIASLVLAVEDGLALQRAADPGAVDIDAVYAELADMVRMLLDSDSAD